VSAAPLRDVATGRGRPADGEPVVLDERVRVGQHRVRTRIVGEGAPLLLINGIGANIEMWRPLATHLPNRQLIMFDMPGTGGSSTPLVPRPMYLYARLTAALIRKLGYDSVDVLGLSWGGAAAQHLAVGFPRTVRRLVLCATLPGWPSVPGSPAALKVMMSRRRYTDTEYLRRVAPTLYGGEIRRDPDLLAEQELARSGRPPGTWGYVGQSVTACSRPSGSLKRALPAIRTLAPAVTAPAMVLGPMPPSTSMSTASVRPRAAIRARSSADLGLHRRDVLLAAEAGVDGHDQHHVDQVEHVLHRRDRSGRVERH
jgi:pimeloyl-ACP methyl ester carboxylesterase